MCLTTSKRGVIFQHHWTVKLFSNSVTVHNAPYRKMQTGANPGCLPSSVGLVTSPSTTLFLNCCSNGASGISLGSLEKTQQWTCLAPVKAPSIVNYKSFIWGLCLQVPDTCTVNYRTTYKKKKKCMCRPLNSLGFQLTLREQATQIQGPRHQWVSPIVQSPNIQYH